MKINRLAGTLFWCCFHRRRLRATSARSCSLACRLFFKAETNMVEEMPDRVIPDLDPTLVQFRQQFAPGHVRLLVNSVSYPRLFIGQGEGLLHPSATPPDCPSRPGAWSSGSPMNGSPDNASPPASDSCRRQLRQRRVCANRENTELPCGLASSPALILNRTFARAGISCPARKWLGRTNYCPVAQPASRPGDQTPSPGSAEST